MKNTVQLHSTESLQKGGYCWLQGAGESKKLAAYITDIVSQTQDGVTIMKLTLWCLTNPTGWIWSRHAISVQLVQRGDEQPIIVPPDWSVGDMSVEERTQVIPSPSYYAVPPVVWKAVKQEAGLLLSKIRESSVKESQDLAHLLERLYAASHCKSAPDVFGEFFTTVNVYSSPIQAFLVNFAMMEYGDKKFFREMVKKLADKLSSVSFSAGQQDEGNPWQE